MVISTEFNVFEAGADINAVGRVWNPLHAAIENNQTEIVKYLLLAKADPNCPYNGGFSALHHVIDVEIDGYQQTNAPELPDATLTKLLVEAGADLDLSYDDQTPLQFAEECHHKYALEFLKGR